MKSLYKLEKEELLEKAEYMIFEYAAYDDTELGKECRKWKKEVQRILKNFNYEPGKNLDLFAYDTFTIVETLDDFYIAKTDGCWFAANYAGKNIFVEKKYDKLIEKIRS